MSEDPGIERLLRLLMMLSNGFGYSIRELAKCLEMSERTVYRYIEILRDAGFIVYKSGNLIKIDKDSPYLKDISDLLHFTREEAWILNRAILALDDETYIKQSLARKLYALYDLKGVPYPVVKRENSDRVVALIRAIEEKKTVSFADYHSSNSSSVTDRLVEPFEFTLNYNFIWCYEISSGANKLFKTARIGRIVLQDQPWQFETKHQSEETDVFRIAGSQRTKVRLLLRMRAANLLVEEYPMAEQFIEAHGNQLYGFSGWVSSFEGVGRFILGLMDDITVISPKALKDFLDKKISGKKF